MLSTVLTNSYGAHSARSPPEGAQKGASCATTMSLLTCYRLVGLGTSRSFHFPLAFGAVCFLSGTQPAAELPLGRLRPHVEKDVLSFKLFVASSQLNVLQDSTLEPEGEATPGPTWPGALGPPQRPKTIIIWVCASLRPSS
jgi:hypothetical protein